MPRTFESARPSSSTSSVYETMSSPSPPCSSGRAAVRKPSEPACRRSRGRSPPRDPTRLRTGAISASQNDRAVSRISRCSSESSKSMPTGLDQKKSCRVGGAFVHPTDWPLRAREPLAVTRRGFDLLALRTRQEPQSTTRALSCASGRAQEKCARSAIYANTALRAPLPGDARRPHGDDPDERAVVLDHRQTLHLWSRHQRERSSRSWSGSTVTRSREATPRPSSSADRAPRRRPGS